MDVHGHVADGVPRWAKWAAYAAALTVLPSGIWRVLGAVGPVRLAEDPTTPPAHHGTILFTGWWYPIALTVVSEALAFLAVGLVATWGERWPSWLPGLAGRRVPVLAAVVPAGLGAVSLTTLWTWAAVTLSAGRTIDGGGPTGLHMHGWQVATFIACYAPLLAWGPLLGLLTIHYYRRRTDPATWAARLPEPTNAAGRSIPHP